MLELTKYKDPGRCEVEILKLDWELDPCWDIEDTEGFENYYIELKAFRLGREIDWRKRGRLQVTVQAKRLECSEELALHLMDLETKIDILEGVIENIYHMI